VPLPNIFLTLLFSELRLKRKDFQEIVRLTWPHEVISTLAEAHDYETYLQELEIARKPVIATQGHRRKVNQRSSSFAMDARVQSQWGTRSR
jgi:hypothetical protein